MYSKKFIFSYFKPNRLTWADIEVKHSAEVKAQKELKEIKNLHDELAKTKSNEVEKRTALGKKLGEKLKERPSYFSPELIRKMYNTPHFRADANIKIGMVWNEHTPNDVMEKLKEDKDSKVRKAYLVRQIHKDAAAK